MKKLIFGLIATVFFGLGANANNSIKETSKNLPIEESTRGKVKVKLELGRQSRGCEGFGVCGFAITYTDVVMGVELEVEVVSVGTVNRMSATVPLKSLEIIKTHFGSDALVLEEDYTIARETAQKIGFSDAYTIKRGTYPVKFDSQSKQYSVIF